VVPSWEHGGDRHNAERWIHATACAFTDSSASRGKPSDQIDLETEYV